MHIAILVTNTDRSAFAARHPGDGEKFTTLLLSRRPDWRVSLFDLPQNKFPDSLDGFDGFLIGGSPASVGDASPWIARLTPLVHQIMDSGKPLFGACFGHQAIAAALGGMVGQNPGGWVLGVTEIVIHSPAPWMAGESGTVRMNAAHLEQVTVVPAGAEVIGGNAECAVGSFRIGERVFATQYHPEMTQGFIAALVEELSANLPPAVTARARASLNQPAEPDHMAGWIVRFFEQGRAAD